jgi:hypothetical protein
MECEPDWMNASSFAVNVSPAKREPLGVVADAYMSQIAVSLPLGQDCLFYPH